MHIRTLPFCVSSAIGGALLLGAGWLWARLVLSAFQRQEGITFLNRCPRRDHYSFWGWEFPTAVTANVFVACALISLFVLWRRGDFFLFTALAGYFVLLAGIGFFLFADLSFAAFD